MKSIYYKLVERFPLDTKPEDDPMYQAQNFLSYRAMLDEREKTKVLKKDGQDFKEMPVWGTNMGWFRKVKDEKAGSKEDSIEKVLSLGTGLYFKQLKSFICFAILASFLSIPGFVLFSSGTPETGKEISEETGALDSIIMALSLGNIGNNEGHPYSINQRLKANNLNLYCDAGTISSIQHYELIYDRISDKNKPRDLDDAICPMRSVPEKF